jgi:Coenzyme PQQ synthesis protein D (PqqD)
VTTKLPIASGDSTQSLQPNPDVLWQRLDGEVIVMQLKTDRIFSLNTTAARCWELIAGGMTLDAARAAMGHEFEVSPEVLAAEFEAILKNLIDEQLLIARE